MEARKILLAFALKYANDWSRIYNAIQNHEELSDEDKARAENFNGNFIAITDSAYPNRLRQKFKPPFVLYYDGDIGLLRHVDDNGGNNNLIFLHGPNTLRIPNDKLCVITADNKIDICGGLKVWFNNETDNIDRYGLAAGLCNNIVGTKIYPENSRSWFISYTIMHALEMGANVYMVSTTGPSYNNRLIKQGAMLIDCYADILSHSPSSNMPY